MAKPAKRATKAKAASAPTIPDPFTAAPAEFAPLLDTLDIDTVYIAHVDNHPAWFKRRIFYVPVGLNAALAALILWRMYYALPWYWDLTMSLLGNHNSTTLVYGKLGWGELVKKVLLRFLTFFMDWSLLWVVAPWPWSFFLESPGNPVSWRWKAGFRDEEVYVRQSRGWGAKDLLGAAEGSSGKAGSESPFFKTRILPALDTKRLREKTGYMLMDKDYDLEFAAMTRAAQLVDKKEIPLDLLRKTVFVWVGSEETGQWAIWDCWRLDEGSETEAREKIVMLKDKLTAMGKENLFFKWVELVQYESNAPGGFTRERQIATADKAKKLFADQGVDFEEFVNDIGGMGGMPGMS